MIIEITLDMKYFVLVLFIACIGFANSFFILARSDGDEPFTGETIFRAFVFSYRMGLGDFDTDGFQTRDEELIYVLWLLNTLIILIVLLNLIIALMGDTFDRVQETAENS